MKCENELLKTYFYGFVSRKSSKSKIEKYDEFSTELIFFMSGFSIKTVFLLFGFDYFYSLWLPDKILSKY